MQEKKTRLYCFSPGVMLATMIIEFGGALYTFVRYRLDRASRIMVTGLISLGTFQLAEYFICEGFVIHGLSWARLGFVAISLLPPLGIELSLALAHQKKRWLSTLIWLSCAAFIIYYGFASSALTSEACLGNYVIFTGSHPWGGYLYGAYYFSQLFIGVALAHHFARQTIDQAEKRAQRGLMLGYLVFIVPTTIVALLKPETQAAIPSVMCGFAVFLALMIIFVVAPSAQLTNSLWWPPLASSRKKSARQMVKTKKRPSKSTPKSSRK